MELGRLAVKAGPVMNGCVSRVGFLASTWVSWRSLNAARRHVQPGVQRAAPSTLTYNIARSSTDMWARWVPGLHVSDPTQAAHGRGAFGGPKRSEAGIS